MAMASREDESDRRCLGKHEANRVDQLLDPFSLHESSAEKHNRRAPVLVFCLRRNLDVLDSIPDDSDALVDPRAVLLQQLSLTPSQGNYAIGVADQSFLPYPLRHTFRRALS